MTLFLGIYTAVYDYAAQTDEELSLKEGDMLYLLEKSSVDDWWTVKKRVIGSDQDEPVGLVPKTYIEESPVIGKVIALYDYEQVQNASEELSFHENDSFDLYDDRDPDWLLVKSSISNEFGFVPGNYVEKSQQPAQTVGGSTVDVSKLPPPPQRVDRISPDLSSTVEESAGPGNDIRNSGPADISGFPAPPQRTTAATAEVHEETALAEPPRMPQRPTNTDHQTEYRDVDLQSGGRSNQRSDEEVYYDAQDDEDYELASRQTRVEQSADDSLGQVWSLSEIDGRKKRKAKLTVSPTKIRFFSAKTKETQEWDVKDLINYDNEKKHLFLEFKNPYINLELHTGSTDVANEIIGILGEIKGAQTAVGLREVQAASRPKLTKRRARILFDFFAESPDELTVRDGDYVNILDDKTSRDWFMCESVETSKRGLVPAQFIDTGSSKSSGQGGESNYKRSRSKSKSRSNTIASTQDLVGSWKEDADQDVSKLKQKTSRFFSKKKKSDQKQPVDKDFPDPKKTRIWVDRSGTFKVEAQYLGCVDKKINLHKVNGVKISVAADKFSDDDLLYIERLTGMSMDKYKSKPKSSKSDPDIVNKERERRRQARERERELEEKEHDRRLREQELRELKKARDLLESEREKLRSAQDKELPPVKPPRPGTESTTSKDISQTLKSKSKSKANNYDWFEFFLNAGVDVNNCQRYTINFEREQISEEILPDIDSALLRTLGLREGDILRVMKYLDNKYGRTKGPSAGNALFTEADGSLKVNSTGAAATTGLSRNLLNGDSSAKGEDDAWTVRPAARVSDGSNKSQDFSGSLQDLLDLQPLEPKKRETPAPDLKHLEPVTSESTGKKAAPLTASNTGVSTTPLDPFKTGGNNLIPIGTGGFVMMPVATGGLLPLQTTGGLLPVMTTGRMMAPQTTFGMRPTGTVLPVQKTANGLIPANTGGLVPQTTFGFQQQGVLPSTTFGSNLTGGAMPLQRTGGAMPLTSFGMQPNIGMPLQRTGGALPTTSFNTQLNTMGMQVTGGMLNMPSNTYSNQLTGNAMNVQPQTTFANQLTGGAINLQPNAFMNQLTGGNTFQQTTGFGNQLTGGANVSQQFSTTLPQTSFGVPQRTGGFQPQSTFGINLQQTGGMNTAPQTSFNNQNGINQVTTSFQNMGLSQQPLQNQPTGFGFGNGPQAQQQRQANIFNASSDNPFGF